jgi:hypothetical protein
MLMTSRISTAGAAIAIVAPWAYPLEEKTVEPMAADLEQRGGTEGEED